MDSDKNPTSSINNLVRPPCSNTGAQNTSEPSLIACVDWLSVTFKDVEDWTEIATFLAIPLYGFEVLNRGQFGYKNSAIYDNISVYFEGNPGMGTHLVLSGSGCRQYEEYFEDGLDWSAFFSKCMNHRIHISRLDIALDDFEQRLNFTTLMRKIKRGELSSKFSGVRDLSNYDIPTGQKQGQTIYFGKSEVMIRFYDKRQERIAKGYSMGEDITTWQRYEVQLRNDRAMDVFEMIAEGSTELGLLVMGILKSYLTFRNRVKNDSNKSRWPISPFWTKFLGDVEKVRFSQVAPEHSILRTKLWLSRQVATSFAMFRIALGDDDLADQYLNQIGSARLSKDQTRLADEFTGDLNKRLDLRLSIREELTALQEDNSE